MHCGSFCQLDENMLRNVCSSYFHEVDFPIKYLLKIDPVGLKILQREFSSWTWKYICKWCFHLLFSKCCFQLATIRISGKLLSICTASSLQNEQQIAFHSSTVLFFTFYVSTSLDLVLLRNQRKLKEVGVFHNFACLPSSIARLSSL